ncbi:hypothetical protein Tco_1302888 [Tanacetum coccineum]
MLESEAFKTYRAYATGEKAPKSKATKKKTDFESSPKIKPSQASKEQMKLATKRSLKEFHISHASSSGDGVDILSKVPDAQQQTRSGTNEGDGDKPEVPDVPEYRSENEKESWTFSQGEDEEEDEEHESDDNDDEDDDQENDSQRTKSDDEGDDFVHPNLSTYIADDQEKEEEKADDDDDDVNSDQKVSTPPDYELTEEHENQQDNDTMGEEKGDGDNEELYRDLNINLSRSDAEMTDAQTNPETEEAHVTLVVSLESDVSELKQTNQFAKALSFIPAIVDKYVATKVEDTVDVAVQLKSDKLREEAQAENQDFLNSLDSNMRMIIKDKFFNAVASSLSELELKNILMDKTKEITLLTDLMFRRISIERYSKHTTLTKTFSPNMNHLSGSDTGNDDVSPVREATDVDERLWNPSGPRTPDHEWNQTKTLNIQNLTQDLLTGPTYDLFKGMYKCVVKLELPSGRSIQATNISLDWHNPEEDHIRDLSKHFL